MDSLFPDVPAIQPIGDELDRCYTPLPLAAAIVTWLDRRGHRPDVVIEPSVGVGAFVRAVRATWPHARVAGFDVDPDAAGLPLCDHAVVGDWTAPRELPALSHRPGGTLILGNPPFSGDTAVPHVLQAMRFPETSVAMILPWGFFGGVERWEFLHGQHRPCYVAPITPRPWSDRVRETALYLWLPWREMTATVVPEPIRWKR